MRKFCAVGLLLLVASNAFAALGGGGFEKEPVLKQRNGITITFGTGAGGSLPILQSVMVPVGGTVFTVGLVVGS